MIIQKMIQIIWNKYVEITEIWKTSYTGFQFNLKHKTIKTVYNNSEMCRTIIDYRNFLLEKFETIKEINFLSNTNVLSDFTCRIKNLNSIDQKLTGYVNSSVHGFGEVPTIKCFNDLFGMRYIYDDNENVSLKTLQEAVNNLDLTQNIKVIDSSKEAGYKAIHLYFKYDNQNFPWELQFWNRKDEQNNKENHERYKQQYTVREIEYKTEDRKI